MVESKQDNQHHWENVNVSTNVICNASLKFSVEAIDEENVDTVPQNFAIEPLQPSRTDWKHISYSCKWCLMTGSFRCSSIRCGSTGIIDMTSWNVLKSSSDNSLRNCWYIFCSTVASSSLLCILVHWLWNFPSIKPIIEPSAKMPDSERMNTMPHSLISVPTALKESELDFEVAQHNQQLIKQWGF